MIEQFLLRKFLGERPLSHLPRWVMPHRNIPTPDSLLVFPDFFWLVCPFLFFLSFLLWPHCTTCGILVPWPGIKPRPQQRKHQAPTTGPPENSLPSVSLFLLNPSPPTSPFSSFILAFSVCVTVLLSLAHQRKQSHLGEQQFSSSFSFRNGYIVLQ